MQIQRLPTINVPFAPFYSFKHMCTDCWWVCLPATTLARRKLEKIQTEHHFIINLINEQFKSKKCNNSDDYLWFPSLICSVLDYAFFLFKVSLLTTRWGCLEPYGQHCSPKSCFNQTRTSCYILMPCLSLFSIAKSIASPHLPKMSALFTACVWGSL